MLNLCLTVYKAALLTRCYVQHFLSPYIDSEVNHKRHFIKIPFINKVMEFIDLHSIFKDNLVISSILSFAINITKQLYLLYLTQVWYLIVSIPDLCTLTYFNKIAAYMNIDSNTPDSLDCQNSNYLYPLQDM